MARVSIRDEIAAEARALGFADIGIARPAIGPAGERLREWVAEGRHGEMAWMADRIDWRADPAALWPEARSVIMLADSYAPEDDPLAVLGRPDRAAISVYAQGRDYHDPLKKRLKRLGRWLIDRAGGDIKVFVDTAPVMEKPLAQAAGLGWQGKHTNVVSRRLGSWFFIGAIFTTLELEATGPEPDHCGSCRRCLDICPTAAFTAPYRLDATRCISYLTIELKGPIPRALRPAIGNRIYGCDDCLAVCPWNKYARNAHEHYIPRPEAQAPPLAELARLDDAAFRERFRGSPVKRTGRGRFVRNVLIAIGNSRDPALAPLARDLTRDEDPLVRGAAVWALSRLADELAFLAARRDDPDPEVAREWLEGLADIRARATTPQPRNLENCLKSVG
ncbi:MAG TPA: tRNA epoxyqueuosine(34) reductase QueG [Paracoccaceae bacterium]|nr:tRNA epoxyqueuosine(34) reductase QueG [Paracoccaceae bacterium]